jgi:hypothetical protein
MVEIAFKAFENINVKDEEAHSALKGLFLKQYEDTPELGEKYYNMTVDQLKQAYSMNVGDNRYTFKAAFDMDISKDSANITDLILGESTRNVVADNYVQPDIKSAMSNIGEVLAKKFKLDTPSARGVFKKSGKLAAIGAIAYLGLNFFRPNQLSNSMNPLDAFTDLGVDIDGNHNIINSNLELERGVPLDMINSSFSKKAFVKLNKKSKGSYNSDKGKVIQNMLRNSFSQSSPFMVDFGDRSKTTYTNYTKSINSFGSSQLENRAELI